LLPAPPMSPSPKPWYKEKWYLRAWFEKEAQQDATTTELHKLSAWAYLSKSQFSEIVLNATLKMSPPIKRGSSVFELGCGVGAALKVLAQWRPVEIAGCDTSAAALKVAAAHFAQRAHAFILADMASGELPRGAAWLGLSFGFGFGFGLG